MELAVKVRPFADETLSSWLMRSAFANGSDPQSFYIALWHRYHTRLLDFDRYLSKEMMDTLVAVSGVSERRIRNMTLKPVMNRIFKSPHGKYSFWYLFLPIGKRGIFRTQGTYFCPEYLRSPTPYLKKEWRMAWNTGCDVHKTRLINRCERCGIAYSPNLLGFDTPHILLCSSCGFDLRISETDAADNDALNFQTTLNEIAFHGETLSFPLLRTHSPKDLFRTIRILVPFFLKIAREQKFERFFKELAIDRKSIERIKEPKTFEIMSLEDRELLLKPISQILKRDIENVRDVLLRTQATKRVFPIKIASSSPTIRYLSKELRDPREHRGGHTERKAIKPNSKEEVERLYNELMEFI